MLAITAGPLAPVAGAAYAIHGAMVGAAAGWVLRILFTLAFGREAFGTGDIYILAAAGAAGGWDIALSGLILSVGFALFGWAIGLLLKQTSMIPFGPWLALGFLAALWLNRPVARIGAIYADNIAAVWQSRPEMLYMAGGIMLVGGVAAVLFARLLRGIVERGQE
jgi:prepilin signal peptidase PulO-like enzyme (type II secretory pathway)